MERIINKIIQEKIDIDKILVVTFTNAAASEMRQRILEAIYRKLEENPEDEQMQRQTVLIAKSNICTIHSFCLNVIRNHFYEIEVSPNFRVGEQTEIELSKQEVLEELFEKKYLGEDKEFIELIHTYTGYQGDEPLKEILLKIYRYIQSSPFPEEWLTKQVEEFHLQDKIEEDFGSTKWGEILLQVFQEEIQSCTIELKSIQKELEKYSELEKFLRIISLDITKMEELQTNKTSWDEIYTQVSDFKFDTWPRDAKLVMEQKEIAKEKRDAIKKKFNIIKDRIMQYNSKQANEDLAQMYPILLALKNILITFTEEFTKKKKERNVIDFNDIEHFALRILVTKNGKGEYVPTEVAKKYQEEFSEIAIDEYQDSNLVQEYILSMISKGNNVFMVGDVKQSIYKFRQARPELFLEKYEHYQTKEDKKEEDNLKIQLFKNFRSRQNIIDITNLIFSNIMSKSLGDMEYNEEEYLNLGADYPKPLQDSYYAGKTELHIIDLKEKEESQEETEKIEDVVVEARLVANRIKKLIESKYQVYDKRLGYRDIRCQDIVVLLRSTSTLAPIYEKEISNLELPVFSDTGSQYLETVEIQTILSVLKIIDNPRQDIPLVTVLRSFMGGLDDNDLIEIKLQGTKKKQSCFYETLLIAKDKVEEKVRNKIDRFLNNIEQWRKKQEYLPLDELIWQIYIETGYYNYVSLMPNGTLRKANLKMLFEKAKKYEAASFKGLFNFINFMDKLKSNNSDMDSAKLIGENEDVIRIMSIHKSKGLEFPVVFLSATGKQFNLQDLKENILLHQDIGLGPKYINYERRIEYNTLAKEAIAYQAKKESLAEEMRVLYVALTRAKEKLIITGLSKDIAKEMNQKEELLDMYQGNEINQNIIKKYKSYLDWIELVAIKNKKTIEELLEITIHEKGEWDYQKEEKTEAISLWERLKEQDVKEKEEYEQLEKILNWEYMNIVASQIPTKTSVTQIKQNRLREKIQEEGGKQNDKEVSMARPKFLGEEKEISNSQKGSLMHLCIQKMDETQEYTKEKIENLVQELVQKQIIHKKEAQSIDIDKLVQYTKSDLWKELQLAKQVVKEQPFYIRYSC